MKKTMRIVTIYYPEDIKNYNVNNKTAVLIDVLRSSSCIVTALMNGCKEIIPALNPGEAFRIAGNFTPESRILGGERGGRPIRGFDLGNSPLDYTAEAVKGKTIIFTSSNGIASLFALQSCRSIFIGSFLNLNAVKEAVMSAIGPEEELLLVCAGNLGKISLEDTLCAGMISHRISEDTSMTIEKSESTLSAESMAKIYWDNIPEVLPNSSWGRDLLKMGVNRLDLEYCARLNSIPLVPYVAPEFRINVYAPAGHHKA